MKTRPFSPSVIALAAAAVLVALVPLALPAAQDETDVKIRLHAEALRARDAGDLAGAQAALAQLMKLTPNDEKVKRLAAEIEAQATAQRNALAQQAAQQQAAEQAAAEAAQRAALERAAADAAAARTADDGRRRADSRATESLPGVSVSLPGQPSAVSPPPSGAAAAMVDVKIPEPGQQTAAPTPAPGPSAAELEAEAIARAETQRLTVAMANAQTALANARGQIREGHPGDAVATADAALAALPANPLTQKLIADLTREKATALLEQAQVLLKRGDVEGARAALAAHNQLSPGSTRAASIERQLTRTEDKAVEKANRPGVDPNFTAERQATAQLIAKGRAQYVAGDIDGAQETFRQVEAKEPDNTTAKGFLLRIAQEKADSGLLNREKTRAQLLEEVSKAWQRPGIYQERTREQDHAAAAAPLLKKLNEIILPNVSFTRADIGQVVVTLSAASEEFDTSGVAPKGVNVVLLDPSNKNPQVTITLRNTSLKRILDFVTEGIGYQYEVQADAVVVRPGGETSTLDTAFFPITRATVLRMTGIAATPAAASGSTGGKDPYSSGGGDGVNTSGEAAGMRAFLQQAGVSFNVEGSSLAYDGSAIIVTQTARNIERIRNILARYNDVRQVEIESKFMEVREGVLEEMGVTWSLTRRGIPQINPATGAPVLDANGRQVFVPQEVYGTDTINRSLTGAFTPVNSVQGINIVGGGTTVATSGATGTTTTTTTGTSSNVPTNAPVIPGGTNVGTGATPLARIAGFVGEFDVNAVVRALSQKQGTDLLSSPKITVLSGNPANITVAQELRYPQSYGEIQSQVSGGTGGTGVTITAGTPQEFTMRNVGVELKVTPTVEEDDYSISLDLNPKVTEFEGFVEYGGPSVAISGGTSVTVPPGFYQPIFSVRDISTKVTIWDGATLVMGGLTREEVKKVNDKVPFFGDIPLVGRLFRSKGESAQKRNLLIFVTANLVSPGGSPKKQSLKSTPANSLFQNPTIVTPASSEARTRTGDK